MPIKPVTYYEAWCDGCDQRQELWGEFTAGADDGTVADSVVDSDGVVVGGLVLCEACLSRVMVAAGDDDEEWDRRHDLFRHGGAEAEAEARALVAALPSKERPA